MKYLKLRPALVAIGFLASIALGINYLYSSYGTVCGVVTIKGERYPNLEFLMEATYYEPLPPMPPPPPYSTANGVVIYTPRDVWRRATRYKYQAKTDANGEFCVRWVQPGASYDFSTEAKDPTGKRLVLYVVTEPPGGLTAVRGIQQLAIHAYNPD
jgi:hypothetical protein